MDNFGPLRSVRAFCADTRGAFATVFAAASVAVIMAAAVMVDATGYNLARNRLQTLADGAALAANTADNAVRVRDGQTSIETLVKDYINQVIQTSDRPLGLKTFPSFSVTLGQDGNGVATVVSLTGVYRPWFERLLPELSVTASAKVYMASHSLELALVLDVTSSMAQPSAANPTASTRTKLEVTKAAAADLVEKIAGAQWASVKVGVVPFGKYVNVGLNNRYASWLTDTRDYADNPAKSTLRCSEDCTRTRIEMVAPCTMSVWENREVLSDGMVVGYKKVEVCTAFGPPVPTPVCAKICRAFWFGCVGSREPPRNVMNGYSNIPYPALYETFCGPPLTRLKDVTTNVGKQVVLDAISALRAELDSNVPTHLPAGLMWGWNVLRYGAVFADADRTDPANRFPRKVLIFMTDGQNERGLKLPWDGTHDTNASDDTDKDTLRLCRNMKGPGNGIEVFTVGFMVNSNSQLLRKCATNSDHYFLADNGEQLKAAFDTIVGRIRSPYIAQ